jgi:hypothetical protein
VANERLQGVGLAGYTVDSRSIHGWSAALYVKTRELHGLSIGAYNRVRGPQVGVSIGIYNSARVLNGVQIGVLNRAQNNKGLAKILPLINAHF